MRTERLTLGEIVTYAVVLGVLVFSARQLWGQGLTPSPRSTGNSVLVLRGELSGEVETGLVSANLDGDAEPEVVADLEARTLELNLKGCTVAGVGPSSEARYLVTCGGGD